MYYSLLTLVSLLFTLATAQSSTAELTGPSQAASGTKPGPNSNGYTYIGCWNETTGITGSGGARALADGGMFSAQNLTTAECLNYCANATYQYCGMQYGRECWAAPYLNSLSTKLNSSNCSYACQGDANEVCGGSLTITLFNLTGKATSTKGTNGGTTSTNAAAVGVRTFFSAAFGAESVFGLWSSAALSGVALLVMVAL